LECENFAKNAIALQRSDLALEAQRKAVGLKASTHESASPLEADAFVAVYAYEALLTRKNGRKTRATATWHAIKRYGIVDAIQRTVNRPTDAESYKALHEMGFGDFAFEALVVRHEASFSADAVRVAKARLAEIA
jgi:hypothetical protein